MIITQLTRVTDRRPLPCPRAMSITKYGSEPVQATTLTRGRRPARPQGARPMNERPVEPLLPPESVGQQPMEPMPLPRCHGFARISLLLTVAALLRLSDRGRPCGLQPCQRFVIATEI